MTKRYIVSCMTEVVDDRLIIHHPRGSYMVPLSAFVVEDPVPPDQQTVTALNTMSMHRIGALIDHANNRIKELEREVNLARAAGFVMPEPPAKPPVEKARKEYKPLDHGARDPAAADPMYGGGKA